MYLLTWTTPDILPICILSISNKNNDRLTTSTWITFQQVISYFKTLSTKQNKVESFKFMEANF